MLEFMFMSITFISISTSGSGLIFASFSLLKVSANVSIKKKEQALYFEALKTKLHWKFRDEFVEKCNISKD